MALLAVVDDLFFRSRIEAAAARQGIPLCTVRAPDPLPAPPEGHAWHLVIIDLNRAADDGVRIVEDVRRALPAVPILGYYSHVQTELQAQALSAGCTTVLPRSAFVQRLPELLAGKLV